MGLVVIWAVISAVFLVLTIFHAILFFWKFKKLEVCRLLRPGVSIQILGQNLDRPMEELVNQLNSFVDSLNAGNRKANGAQALGYFAAFVTAVISLIISISQLLP